jgi:hypothetical protein
MSRKIHFPVVFGTSVLHAREVPRVLLFGLVASLILVLIPTAADAQAVPTFTPNPLHNPICSRIGNQIQVSLGLRMYCFGPQPNGPGTASPATSTSSSATISNNGGTGTSSFSKNVNAANLAEDITPNGTRVYGQAETSIAASGPYVLEAWNDATGFFSSCGSPMYKEELTGLGFSNDGGNTFTDLGGLPNSDCSNNTYFGDPSVEALQVGGITYFYISSLYDSIFLRQGFPGPVSYIAISVCTVSGSGTLSCSQPVIAAKSSEDFSLLDKDFMTIDPINKRLYISYTEFTATGNGQIELAACDLTNPAMPDCQNGSTLGPGVTAPPYYVVAPGDSNCEQEGSYPAADRVSHDLYVAWEFNWGTNYHNSACFSTPVQNMLARIPSSCLGSGPPSMTIACPTSSSTSQPITSMDLAIIPGYNRIPINDFPRIAVSDPAGTVSIVWNDAGSNPGGDILLRSFSLGSLLTPTGMAPVKINNDNVVGTFHFLPALRYANSNGKLSISWYDRRQNPNSALTDVFAAVAISPRIISTPTSNQRVTDTASNWEAVSADTVPNFGDYTDNYVSPCVAVPQDDPLFVAWTDGRLSVPQPFESHAGLCPGSH